MNASRRVFALLACSSFAVLAVACASAPASSKTLVVDCDKSQDDSCDEQESNSSKRSGSSSGGPRAAPEEAEPQAATSSADAGKPDTDAGASSSSGGTGARGPSCTALAACCDKLEKAGFTGSVRQCRSVVTTNNEYACSVTKADYAKPIDGYDAICP